MKSDITKLKVALVHDFLVQWGGAERVLQALGEVFPQADIYTILADNSFVAKYFPEHKIYTSFIQKLPFTPGKYKFYLPLMPKAVESFNLDNYDLVFSDSSAFAKGVKTSSSTLHICYLHTPTRYLWEIPDYYIQTSIPKVLQPFFRVLMPYLKRWDTKASKRPDKLIANSKTIYRRTLKYYHRSADAVIYPFVDLDKFLVKPSKPALYYLISGRLVPYKRFDIVIEAFNRLGLDLHVIGTGYGENKLKSQNRNPKTIFLGSVSDETLVNEYKHARAFIFPSYEDFGITPLESLAAARPVIAYGAGGVTETVKNNQNGIYFNRQTPQSLINAIQKYQRHSFSPAEIQKSCLNFSKERFKKEIVAFVAKTLKEPSAKVH